MCWYFLSEEGKSRALFSKKWGSQRKNVSKKKREKRWKCLSKVKEGKDYRGVKVHVFAGGGGVYA